jgi:hypothetical protein
MTIQRTVENPASRRLTITVPQEIPVGPVILTFTPAKAKKDDWRSLCGKYKDPDRTVADFMEDRVWDNLIEEVRMADRDDREIPPQVVAMAARHGVTIEALRQGTYR